MRVCVCNCGSHPHLSFPFFNLSQHPVARHPTARDTIYRITSLSITTYPYASHKPVERDRSIDPLGRSGFLIFLDFSQIFLDFSRVFQFSQILTFACYFFHRCFSTVGFGGRGSHLATIFGEELDDGFDFSSSTKTSGSWIASSSTRGH